MKYIPILNSRDAELSVIYENRSAEIVPFIKLIKEKYRKNSKHNFISDFKQNIKTKYFVEIVQSREPGNTQVDVASFLRSMSDINAYAKEAEKLSRDNHASVVIPVGILFMIQDSLISEIKNLSIRITSVSDLAFLSFINFASYNKIFIDFNAGNLTGTSEKVFKDNWAKYKEKIIFVFDNHKRNLKNIDATENGKLEQNHIKTGYTNFDGCYGFADFCMMQRDILPASGGQISPGIKIQLDKEYILHIGDSITDIKDAKFSGYTNAAKHLFSNQYYKKCNNIYSTCNSYNLLLEATKGINPHFITPLRAKYITLDHYFAFAKTLI